MKKHAVSLFLVLSCATLIAGGCAKHEMVKTDEPIVPAAAATAKPPVKTDSAPASAETVKEQPVKESRVQDTLKPISQAGELKAALEEIYFDFNGYVLSPKARDTLAKNAELIKKDTGVKVLIEGNCDERGSDEYNLALGEKRARSAMQYLVTMGIPTERLSVISYGKEKPADPGHDEAAWSRNRRSVFVLQR